MTSHLVGEFRPPRELASIGAARVTGVGALDTLNEGLAIDGRILSEPPVPRTVLLGVLVVVIVAGAVVPGADRVALPLLLALGAVGGWFAYRSEVGVRSRHVVPWSAVEHVARLPADHDVVAIVFSSPVAGTGTPEQVYFAPSLGVEALADAFRDRAPQLSMDLESALRSVPEVAEPDDAS